MKKFIKLLFLVFLLLFGYDVFALDIGKTEELVFSTSNIKQASGNSDTLVFYDIHNVYYYNIERNELTTIYTADTQVAVVFVRENIAYVCHKKKGESAQLIVHEINALTGDELSSTNINRVAVINGSFVVDLKGNYYFEENDIIDIYNKNGEKINSVTSNYTIGSLNQFSPNDEYLFVDYSYYHEGILKLENGELKSGDMYRYSNRMPEWKFASDGKTAVNQYGEIALFDFTNLSQPYLLKLSAISSEKYYSYPTFYETSDKYYIPNSKGFIVGISKTDYKKKDKYLIEENCFIISLKYINNSLYVLYKLDSKYYVKRLDLSKDKIMPTHTLLNSHTTLSHTKSQIQKKYNAAKAKADYTNRYKEEPSKVNPYYEGVLKDDVVQDTLNQLNYYRYLAGLTSVTLNSDKQARSQKCALVQAVNKVLSHYPTKPADMDTDFYNEAKAGCGARYAEGDTYSGNVSYNTRIDKAPGGFIDDNNNLSPGVGHRSSMLDPFAKKVSFGNVQPYVAMSIYYDNNNSNKDLFYAWPSAGYFPSENIYQTEKTMWSIWLDSSIKVQNNSIITLTYKNKKYTIPLNETVYDSTNNVIAYYLPSEIRNKVVSNTNRFINGEKVHVNISNLSDYDINTYEIDYDVTFFVVETVDLETIEIITYREGSSVGSVYRPNATINLNFGEIYEIQTRTTPSNSTVGRFTYQITDSTIASINNDKIIPKKGGNTTLTVTDSYTKKSFTYSIKVYEKPTNVSFSDSKVTIKIGERYTLKPIIEPSSATIENGRYSSSDSNIAYVSNGQVVGVKKGKVTITYQDTYHSDVPAATIEVTVVEDSIAVTGLSFANPSMALEVGQTSSINAIITPENATDKTITWTSSNKNVAKVVDGKVTGIMAGEATITGKTSNGKKATCQVVVSDKNVAVTGITVSKHDVSLSIGESETITATITPTNATVKEVVWTSKNPSIVTVNNGTITGVGKGATEVVASAGNISVVIKVEVVSKNVDVSGISLNKTSLSLDIGSSEVLSVNILPENATNKTVKWTSSDTSVATVSKGKVIALKEGKTVITARTVNGLKATCNVTVKEKEFGIYYTTHVENIGWQDYVANGVMAGTSGKSLRLEGIKIKLVDSPYTGNILYRTHIQDYGWEAKFKKNNEMSGTSGQAKRLEAIEIKLTGDISNYYDVYYRVHAQNVGWMNWAKNGERAGTAGYAYRLEGIEIVLVKKGENPPNRSDMNYQKSFLKKDILYTTHVQNIGWQDYTYDGNMAGTSGQALRLEGIKIKLDDPKYSGNVLYRTHIQNIGWESKFKKNDEMSGTSGQALRLEAIEIKLDGEMAKHYDIYYRVHAENFGWMNWAKNGERAGTAGYAYRLEGIEIVLVEKGENPPVRTNINNKKAYIEK